METKKKLGIVPVPESVSKVRAEPRAPTDIPYNGGLTIFAPFAHVLVVLDTLSGDLDTYNDFLTGITEHGYYTAPNGVYQGNGIYYGPYNLITGTPQFSILFDSQIQTLLIEAIQRGFVPFQPYPPIFMYTILLPANVQVQIDGGISCFELCGYHNNLAFAGRLVPYSVIPDSESISCVCANPPVPDPIAARQKAIAHEYGEMRSDPNLDAWTGPFGENGDECNNFALLWGPNLEWTVQPLWINGGLGCAFTPLYGLNQPPYIGIVAPNSGSIYGGQTVVISGSNLDNATSVTFGGAPALQFTVVDSTQIRAVTPPHFASTVDIQVTTPIATSAPNPGIASAQNPFSDLFSFVAPFSPEAILFDEIPIRPDSTFWVKTNGRNSQNIYGLSDDNGEPYKATDITVFASIFVQGSGIATVLNLPLHFVSIGYWTAQVPASACQHGVGPWEQRIEVYDSTGLTGRKLATFYNSLVEDNTM